MSRLESCFEPLPSGTLCGLTPIIVSHQPCSTTTGVVVHKDAAWKQQWDNLKDNNPVVDGFFNLRMKFDESDNILVRGARNITDIVSEKLGSGVSDDESVQALEEITKMDPAFETSKFLLHCEKFVVPSVLEVRPPETHLVRAGFWPPR